MDTIASSRAERSAGLPPLATRFQLGSEITPEQAAFLDVHGFLVFAEVASADEIAAVGDSLRRIERLWIEEDRRVVNGIPIFWGRIDGKPAVQRFAFSSLFSQTIRDLVRAPRFEPIRRLIGVQARVGDDEKDGVVVNRFLNARGSVAPALGWHTDGLRDLFYGRMPQKMLNVGLHLDDCPIENGGLRLIPGSHLQGFAAMCLRKPYFVSHRPDPEEFAVVTRPGDLTVHDGRLWHRVARSRRRGAESLRRSMYVPYLTGPYEPKSEHSPTPAYHHLGRVQRWLRARV